MHFKTSFLHCAYLPCRLIFALFSSWVLSPACKGWKKFTKTTKSDYCYFKILMSVNRQMWGRNLFWEMNEFKALFWKLITLLPILCRSYNILGKSQNIRRVTYQILNFNNLVSFVWKIWALVKTELWIIGMDFTPF